jgi:hypothetical protein
MVPVNRSSVGNSPEPRYVGPVPRKEGTHVRLPAELWRRIDAYRREHPGMPSRPGAIQELVEMGFELVAMRKKAAKGKPKS